MDQFANSLPFNMYDFIRTRVQEHLIDGLVEANLTIDELVLLGRFVEKEIFVVRGEAAENGPSAFSSKALSEVLGGVGEKDGEGKRDEEEPQSPLSARSHGRVDSMYAIFGTVGENDDLSDYQSEEEENQVPLPNLRPRYLARGESMSEAIQTLKHKHPNPTETDWTYSSLLSSPSSHESTESSARSYNNPVAYPQATQTFNLTPAREEFRNPFLEPLLSMTSDETNERKSDIENLLSPTSVAPLTINKREKTVEEFLDELEAELLADLEKSPIVNNHSMSSETEMSILSFIGNIEEQLAPLRNQPSISTISHMPCNFTTVSKESPSLVENSQQGTSTSSQTMPVNKHHAERFSESELSLPLQDHEQTPQASEDLTSDLSDEIESLLAWLNRLEKEELQHHLAAEELFADFDGAHFPVPNCVKGPQPLFQHQNRTSDWVQRTSPQVNDFITRASISDYSDELVTKAGTSSRVVSTFLKSERVSYATRENPYSSEGEVAGEFSVIQEIAREMQELEFFLASREFFDGFDVEGLLACWEDYSVVFVV